MAAWLRVPQAAQVRKLQVGEALAEFGDGVIALPASGTGGCVPIRILCNR